MNHNFPSTRVGILNVGMGNVPAIESCLRRLSLAPIHVSNVEGLKKTTHLILPGVGAMGELMSRIESKKLTKEIVAFAGYGKLLGICLGFQALFSYSDEGECSCLNLIDGGVEALRKYNKLKTNVGYRNIERINMDKEYPEIVPTEMVPAQTVSTRTVSYKYYFTHSFFVPIGAHTTHYTQISKNLSISSVSCYGQNIFGTQFHPELSHAVGRKLISNFLIQ